MGQWRSVGHRALPRDHCWVVKVELAAKSVRRRAPAGGHPLYHLARVSGGDEEVSALLAAIVFIFSSSLVIAWEVVCLSQVLVADRVRFLPRWAWAIACLIFIPLGGVLFLALGRAWGHATLS